MNCDKSLLGRLTEERLRLLIQALPNINTIDVGDENLTLITRSSDGRKSQVHYGDNNPSNWMPKFIQMKLRARGDLPKNHKIKGWDDR